MMSSHVTESVSSIYRAAGSPKNANLTDVVRGLYYTLALHRWQRGQLPSMQEEEHVGAGGVDVQLVTELLYYSTFAIHFAYITQPLDLQRLLAQQGYALIAAEMNSGESPELPAYFLSASRKREEVILAVRGTASANDFGTDVIGTPVPFPEGKSGMAHKGIVGAVNYLYGELRGCLEEFARFFIYLFIHLFF